MFVTGSEHEHCVPEIFDTRTLKTMLSPPLIKADLMRHHSRLRFAFGAPMPRLYLFLRFFLIDSITLRFSFNQLCLVCLVLPGATTEEQKEEQMTCK